MSDSRSLLDRVMNFFDKHLAAEANKTDRERHKRRSDGFAGGTDGGFGASDGGGCGDGGGGGDCGGGDGGGGD